MRIGLFSMNFSLMYVPKPMLRVVEECVPSLRSHVARDENSSSSKQISGEEFRAATGLHVTGETPCWAFALRLDDSIDGAGARE